MKFTADYDYRNKAIADKGTKHLKIITGSLYNTKLNE